MKQKIMADINDLQALKYATEKRLTFINGIIKSKRNDKKTTKEDMIAFKAKRKAIDQLLSSIKVATEKSNYSIIPELRDRYNNTSDFD